MNIPELMTAIALGVLGISIAFVLLAAAGVPLDQRMALASYTLNASNSKLLFDCG